MKNHIKIGPDIPVCRERLASLIGHKSLSFSLTIFWYVWNDIIALQNVTVCPATYSTLMKEHHHCFTGYISLTFSHANLTFDNLMYMKSSNCIIHNIFAEPKLPCWTNSWTFKKQALHTCMEYNDSLIRCNSVTCTHTSLTKDILICNECQNCLNGLREAYIYSGKKTTANTREFYICPDYGSERLSIPCYLNNGYIIINHNILSSIVCLL